MNWNPENNRIIITRVDLGALILINWLNNNLKRFNPVSISNGIESDERVRQGFDAFVTIIRLNWLRVNCKINVRWIGGD